MSNLQKELQNALKVIQSRKEKLVPQSRAAHLLRILEQMMKEQVQNENSNPAAR